MATYARALQQRNNLLRRIREGEAARDRAALLGRASSSRRAARSSAGAATLLADLAGPLAAAHAEIAPAEAALRLRYVTNAPSRRRARRPRRRCAGASRETAEKELWNGATLVGPHRDDLAFELGGRDLADLRLARPAAHGHPGAQAGRARPADRPLDGEPPLLLLDDVFSELDPDRRAHLVRRIGGLPQAFVTTTTLDDLDPALVAASTTWHVRDGVVEAGLAGAAR